MKKFLTIATIGVLVLALAAVTYAVDLKASGLVRNRTALYKNAETSDISTAAGIDDTNSFVDYRSRIRFTLVASEDLEGNIYFESNDKWGVGGGVNDKGALVGTDGISVQVQHA
ncbi:MAG: hypothetical protein GTO13_09295, partial [Proteobacteria bacterium]|nr:hypothetical protein [Pseudomonadota bacterium]